MHLKWKFFQTFFYCEDAKGWDKNDDGVICLRWLYCMSWHHCYYYYENEYELQGVMWDFLKEFFNFEIVSCDSGMFKLSFVPLWFIMSKVSFITGTY